MTNPYIAAIAASNNRLGQKSSCQDATGLTVGGRLIWHRTHRPVHTCNAIAALAGIGGRVAQ